VSQVARRVIIRFTLIVKRTCGIYANGKRRKLGEDTAPLSHMKNPLLDIWKMARRFLNPHRSQISAHHDPDAWLLAFASKIAPDFALNEFSVSYLASERFLSLEEPFIMDEFEAALDSGSV
jgi:hypothetical protein